MDCYERRGVLVVKPDAYMDLSFKRNVLPRVDRHIDGGGGVVLVNCADVDLINSYGISALLSIYDRLDGSGGTLAFAGVGSPLVENAFAISGISSFCAPHFYGSEEEAVDELS